MAYDIHSLFAYSTIASVTSQTTTTAIVTVQTGDGTRFSPNEQATLWPGNQGKPLFPNAMVGRITGISGDQLTLDITSPNREGSSQLTITAGFQIINAITPKIFKDIETSIVRSTTLVIAASNSKNTTNADYVCNGITDGTTINTAIAALPAGGGRIVLLEGMYVIDTTITLAASFITITGEGWNTILKPKAGLNSYVFTCNNTNFLQSCIFADFKIDGDVANQTTGGGINAQGVTTSVFNRLWFMNCYGICLNLNGRSDNAFGSNNLITGCQFTVPNGSSNATEGIHIQKCDENKIVGNIFSSLANYSVYDSSGTNIISENAFVNGGIHINVQDTANTIITSNVFDTSGKDSITIVSSRCLIENNQFSNIGVTTANTYSGVKLTFGDHNIVRGNMFRSAGTNGQTMAFVNERDTQSYNDITGNTFTLNGSLGTDMIVSLGTNTTVGPNTGLVRTVTKTANYSLLATDVVILADATSAGFTLTLPDATTCVDREYVIKKIDSTSHTVILATVSSQTIDGLASITLSTQNTTLQCKSNGVNWYLL